MGDTIIAEYLIAVLVAMAIVVTFRRKVPRTLEVAIWATLIYVCVLAITNTPNPQARALTTATAWAAGRIVGMIAGLTGQSVARWTYGERFVIAGWVVVLFALDLFVLALVSTRRQANAWIPVTRLGEWMVLPGLAEAQPARAAVSGVDEINERLNVWGAAAAAATMTWSILFFIWLRDVEIPYAARGLRKVEWGTVAAWRRVAAGRPQLGQLRISRIVPVLNAVSSSRRPKVPLLAESAPLSSDKVDIKLLAQRADARKAKAGRRLAPAGATRRSPRRRAVPIAPQPEARTDKNGSKKKHRQGRLAS
jgi:hypothetical protein